MKKITISMMFLLLVAFTANAQVKDISVTISPAAEYTWWDNHAGMNDAALIGGKVGFGFGEYMELRGVYLQSYDLQTNFENFGLANYNKGLFTPQDITLKRWGGEFKANIGTGGLKPYLTIGTGIQNIDVKDGEDFEQIYASLGLGLKFNFSERAIFLLEGKNTMYNFNAGANLLSSEDKKNFVVANSDFESERLSNWAIQGAFQFYLGGRRPGTMTELDKAYLNKFSGGLRGLQPIIEPGVGYIEFDKNSLFRDTWMVGGYAGLDFNDYIGIRAFYFQAVEELDISTDFDNLSMYGVELRARLNDNAGVTPYISLGGGYLNSEDNYRGINGAVVEGGEFASGGLGLNIPLGKRVLINGGAKAMITSTEDVLDISVPDNLQTHMMYNAGIKFTLGKKARSTDEIYQRNVNSQVDDRMSENNAKLLQIKSEYQSNIAALEDELKLAYEANDANKAAEVIVEKQEVEKSLEEIKKLEVLQEENRIAEVSPVTEISKKEIIKSESIIRMSPAEFESLVVKILKATNEKPPVEIAPVKYELKDSSLIQQNQYNLLNQRIDFLEKLILEINNRKETGEQFILPDYGEWKDKKADDTFSEKILDELEALNRKIELNSDRIYNERNQPQTFVVTPPTDTNKGNITLLDENGKVIGSEKIADTDQRFIYKNSSVIFGLNVGGATTTNLGARLHYAIRNTPLEFMPEIYIGVGGSTSFGVSGNVIYPFQVNSDKVLPYAGVGLGLARIDKNLRGNYNVILGTELPFIIKNLSVDYTMRNSFDYNQLAIMYKLSF